MRHKLPSVSEVLFYLGIRILAIITARLYTPFLSSFARDHGYTQYQNTILFVSIGLTLLLVWMVLFFLGRRILLGIGFPGLPELLSYLVSHLLPFAISLSGLTTSMFILARNNGISVDQFNIAYTTGNTIVVMLMFFGLRQLFASASTSFAGMAISNAGNRTPSARHADDYDHAKWAALVKYDEDIAAAENIIRPLGQRWVDELARSYLALGDKAYLKKIVAKIQEAAASGAESEQTQSRTSPSEIQITPQAASGGEPSVIASGNFGGEEPKDRYGGRSVQLQASLGGQTTERASKQGGDGMAKATGSSTAALIFGILGGLFGLFIGLFGYAVGGIVGAGGQSGAGLFQFISIAIPIAGLVGGGMAKSNAIVAGVLMVLCAVGMLLVFGFNFFTAIPVVLSGIGGALALVSASDAKATTA